MKIQVAVFYSDTV